MKNFVQPGCNLTVTAPAGGVSSGDPVKIGSLFGVAAYSAPAGAPLEITTEGVFDLPKAAGVAFAQGDKAYFDTAAKDIAAAANGLSWVGVVTEGVLAGAASVRVRLNHVPV